MRSSELTLKVSLNIEMGLNCSPRCGFVETWELNCMWKVPFLLKTSISLMSVVAEEAQHQVSLGMLLFDCYSIQSF